MLVMDYVEAVGGTQPIDTAATYARFLIRYGPAYSLFIDDALAFVVGVVGAWPRVGEAWSVWTDVGRAHPLTCSRTARRMLRMAAPDYDRIQTDTVAAFDAANRWVLSLGFTLESKMPKAGPYGQDFLRYALFPGGK